MMRRTVCLFMTLMVLGTLSAARYTITGKVVNRDSGEQLEMAAVRLFSYQGSDSTMVTGAQTNWNGDFVLEATPGEYGVVVSMLGYRDAKQTVTVVGKDVNMRTFRLQEVTQELSTVEVKGKAAEMTVKGDTLEYNTAAYKMNENAMVEDLLKKMSGVTVDSEGKVTVNGEEIKGVRIDGKKFFGNDVQAATKNIPADMIEKIQVIDEKSDMAKITGIEDEDSERIINLTLKQDRKKGLFGNYKLGAGADMVGIHTGEWFKYFTDPETMTAAEKAKQFMADDFRYTGNLFMNIMSGESQTTIIGSAGNNNEIRTGRGRGGFFGQANEGITRAENIGVNTNVDFADHLKEAKPGASLLLGGDASMNHSINNAISAADKTIYSQDLTYHNLDSTDKEARTWDAQMRLEIEYKPDTLNKVLIKPNISYTNTETTSNSNYEYQREDVVIKDGWQEQTSLSEEIQAKLQVIYSHNFSKPGRVLSIDAQAGVTDTKGNSSTLAYNELLSNYDVDQRVTSKSDNANYSVKVSWMEPIYGRNHFLETAVSFRGSHRSSSKDQQRYKENNAQGEKVYEDDTEYSNRMRNNYYQEILQLNYRLVKPKLDLTVGVQANPSQTHSMTYYGGQLNRDTLISVWNFSPNASFKYNFGKRDFMRLRYRGNSTQPSVTQMEPVRNNSNVMYESVGNLGLNPAFNHHLFFMYSKYNEKHMSSIMTGVRGSMTKDALVSNVIYDKTGKQYSQTVNAKELPWSVNADFMYNTPFANKLMQFHTRTTIGYNQRVGYILREQETADIEDMIANNTFALGDASRTGNLSAGEDINLRLTHQYVDVGVRATVNYNRTQNSLNNVVNNTINWGVTGDLEFHLPRNWNITTNCGYTARYGYQLDNVNEIILNASIDKTWRNATLSLAVNDILHQKKNIVQVVTADAVTYKSFNTLPTYFMLTFSYKINKMGDLKAKGHAGFMQQMMESGGAPGRGGFPPMGPPPGR